MLKTVNKLFGVIDKVMIALSAIVLGSMTLMIFLQVLARYIFKAPLAWSEEAARFLFIWMTFIAGYVAARRAQHIYVELIQNMFPQAARKVMQVLSNLIAAGFFLMVFYYILSLWGKLSCQVSPALNLQMSYVYLGMMIGCFLMGLCYFLNVVAILLPGRSGNRL